MDIVSYIVFIGGYIFIGTVVGRVVNQTANTDTEPLDFVCGVFWPVALICMLIFPVIMLFVKTFKFLTEWPTTKIANTVDKIIIKYKK